MSPEVRIDADYNASDDDLRMLLKSMHRLLERPSGNQYQEGPPDNREIKSWILGVGVVITGAFVIGGWTLSNQVAGLAAKMESFNARIDRIEREQDGRRTAATFP